jgi:hypothetical protein
MSSTVNQTWSQIFFQPRKVSKASVCFVKSPKQRGRSKERDVISKDQQPEKLSANWAGTEKA